MFESRKKDIGTTYVTMITIKCVHASSKNRWTSRKKNKSKFDDFRAVYTYIYIAIYQLHFISGIPSQPSPSQPHEGSTYYIILYYIISYKII